MSAPRRRPAAGRPPAAGPPVVVDLLLPMVAVPPAADAHDAVADVVLAHQRALGVPGQSEVRIRHVPSGSWRMRVNGRRAGCAEIAAVVREATRGRTGDLSAVAPEEVVDVLTGLCTESLQTRPSVLLHPAHVPAVLAGAGFRGDQEGAAEALVRVLDSGVAIGQDAVARSIGGDSADLHPVEMTERLIDTGRSAAIDVLVAPATLRSLTSGPRTDVFPALREDLYAESGVLGPDFRLTPDPGLPEGVYAFTANALRTRPRRLPPGAGPADVAVPLGVLLRRRAAWFLSMQSVQELGDRLALVLPDTVAAVRARYPLEWLTAMARAAAEEGTSLRNLATLLDRLLDIDVHPPDDAYLLREGSPPPQPRGPADLPRPRDAVALLRQRMREETSRIAPLGAERVHRLGPVLEQRLRERLETSARAGLPGDDGTGEDTDEVVGAVRRMVRAAPELPLVAPSLPMRSWLWDALRADFPALQVVALTEYPPGLDVVPWPVAGAEEGGG